MFKDGRWSHGTFVINLHGGRRSALLDFLYEIPGCISRRLTLLFVTAINTVVNIKRHTDLGVINISCFLFSVARVCSIVRLLLAYVFVYCVLFFELVFCWKFTTW